MANVLGLSYIGLSIFVIIVILSGYYKTILSLGLDIKERRKKILTFILPFLIWYIYLFLIERSGILLSMEMPPKFPLLIFSPFVIFLIIFYFRNRKNKSVQAIPIKWPIYFQSFRVFVELLILYTFFSGIIPKSASFEGYNYDILMGLTAPIVALLVYRTNNLKKRVAYFWNMVGIIMILWVGFIIASSLYFPTIWGGAESLVSDDFLKFPYLLLPAFLAPMGIFMHVIALIQLSNIE